MINISFVHFVLASMREMEDMTRQLDQGAITEEEFDSAFGLYKRLTGMLKEEEAYYLTMLMAGDQHV